MAEMMYFPNKLDKYLPPKSVLASRYRLCLPAKHNYMPLDDKKLYCTKCGYIRG